MPSIFGKHLIPYQKISLLHVFKVFGFGADFQKWVSVLTKGTASCINRGGWVSEPFKVLCGIWQGCPFSPLVFVQVVELMAIKIRNNSTAGIESPDLGDREGGQIKINQLVDDTSLFLKNKQDTENLFTLLKEFESYTGLKLNVQKTEAQQVCSQREHEHVLFKAVDKIKSLEMYFENEKKKMAKEIKNNWIRNFQ